MRLFFFILTICLLAYSNTFHTAWQLDDRQNILFNKGIHISSFSLSEINDALKANPSSSENALYRPLACLTFGLNWYISQENVFSYHVVNLAIHILTAWFLFLTLRLLLFIYYQKKYPSQFFLTAALLATLFWVSAPVQTQAITYIVQRMASMAAMFSIIAIYAYLRGRTASGKRYRWFILCLISSFAALGSKENAILLFPSLILVEFSFFQRNITRKQVIYFILGSVAILTALLAFVYYGLGRNLGGILDSYDARAFTLSERMLTQPRIILMYLSQIFIPVAERFSIEHNIILSTSLLSPWTTLPAILSVLLLIAGSFFFLKKYPLICFPILFFFLNHAIESTIIPLELFFEHRNYLPSLFFFLPAGVLIAHILYGTPLQPIFRRTTAVICAILFLIISAHATYTRNKAWATEESLWSDVLRKYPDNPRAVYMIGMLHDLAGQTLEAYHAYQFALDNALKAANPKDMTTGSLNGLGTLAYKNGLYKSSLQYYTKCLDLNSDFEACLKNRILTFFQLRQPDKAFIDSEKLIKYNENSVENQYLNIISGYYSGNTDTSLALIRQIAKYCLNEPRIMYVTGLIMMKKGAYPNGLFFLKQAVKLAPNNISSQLALAATYHIGNKITLSKKLLYDITNNYPLPIINIALKKMQREHWNVETIDFIKTYFDNLIRTNSVHNEPLSFAVP